jgi:hypothetical protein
VLRDPQRAEKIGQKLMRLAKKRREEPLVSASVVAQLSRGVLQRLSQQHGRLAVERVGDGGRRMNPT